jgi:hypothetical protein
MPVTVQGVRVTAIISAYNEADIIAQTVADLVLQGIAVHVIDDHSTDGTVAALRDSSGMVRIETLERPPGAPGSVNEFPWSGVLVRKQQLARELDADWFIHHDADEFRESPWGHLNLRQGIELVDRLGYNAIDFAVLNFWPTHDRFDPASDVRDSFPYYEAGARFDEVQVKCWKKTPDVELVSSGGHEAVFEGRRVFPLRFLLRHYPIRGQAHGTRKVFDERRGRFSADERQRGWHVQYDAFEPGMMFLREPDSLERYDADVVRARLQLEHRGVEEQAARLAAVGDLLAAAREEQAAAVRALGDQHATEVRRLTAEIGRQSESARDLSAAYQAVESQFQALEVEYRALEKMSCDLERQLADMRQSWSWKLTAPLRTAWRRPTQ